MGYYDDLAVFGGAQAVGWRGLWDQAYRYLSTSLYLSDLPIIDIGCGRGGLAEFLSQHSELPEYLGVDSFQAHRAHAFQHPNVSYRWDEFDPSQLPEHGQFVCIGALVGNDGDGVSLANLLGLRDRGPVILNGLRKDWLKTRPWSDPALEGLGLEDLEGIECWVDEHMPASDMLVAIGVENRRVLSARKRLEVLREFLKPDESAIRLCSEVGEPDFLSDL